MSDQEKICVVCGQNCAGQPRIKDPSGHYYHKQCHEELERAHAEREAQAAAAPAPPVVPPHDDAPAEIAEHEPPAQGDAAACPGCGEPMLLGAIICTNCGFNAQTGRMVDGTALPGEGDDSGGPAWPAVIGIISIVLGGGGAALHALRAAMGVLAGAGEDGSAAYSYGQAIGSLLGILLSLWLLAAGIGVLQRKQTAAVSIRRWAIVKLVLYGTCFTCVSIGLIFMSSLAGDLSDELSGGEFTVNAWLLFALVAAVFAWFLAWPIFILVWFGRDVVQQQITQWR